MQNISAFFGLARLVVAVLSLSGELYAGIIEVSRPVGSDDDVSRVSSSGVWTVSAPPYPLTTNSGIGYILNSSVQLTPDDFTIHDHQYINPFVPDPERAVVTYTFDQPTVVGSLRLVQHRNGLTQLEGFVGDSLDAMASIGIALCERGDVTGNAVFNEGEISTFTFTKSPPARYFRFIIRKTSFDAGYALYRAFPRDEVGADIPPGSDFFVSLEFAQVDVCWPSKTNKVYQVESRSAVQSGDWLPLGSPVRGNGQTNCIADIIRGQPKKYYRVVIKE